jgi:hypothetical protein
MADNSTLPATGDVIASDDIGGVKYQRIKNTFGPDGTATDVSTTSPLPVVQFPTNPVYVVNQAPLVHVASANTVHLDLFNAHASLVVRVLSFKHVPDMVDAVTGVAFAWKLARTTAVGTGGSALTPALADTSDTALDAAITCRSKPTGGATEGTILENYQVHSEETNAATIMLASLGGLELVPPAMQAKGIVLRQNQGLRTVQITSSAAGYTGWWVVFTVE